MKVTTDHHEIKLWSQAHRGRPEIVDDPTSTGDEPFLRIDFPGDEDNVFLEENTPEKRVTWDNFFAKFDELQLAFMYEENAEGEDLSLAYRFIKRDQADQLS